MSVGWNGQLPDQSGRIAVITGANRGLGLIVARELARAGAEVVIACRSEANGARAVSEIQVAAPGAKAVAAELDLSSLASIRGFAERFIAQWPGLDLLVNNAAVAVVPHQRTEDGFELQLGTNHLGHFALTGRLLDALKSRSDSRVVSVSAQLHTIGRISFDDLQSELKYSPWRAYAQSKLATLLFALELDRLLRGSGAPVLSVAAHPGSAKTHSDPQPGASPFTRVFHVITNRFFAKSPEVGAMPFLYAATAPDLAGGSYVGPGPGGGAKGPPTVATPSKTARDQQIARRLWTVSEQLTGVTYDFAAPVARQR